jgi:hypothetical protein
VIGLPPLLLGAENVTVALPGPAVALTFVGMPGTVAGITAFDDAEGKLLPTLLVAVTAKV